MKDRGQPDAGAEVFGIGGDGGQGLGRGLEEDRVDDGFVVVGDVGDRRRQGEDDMVIFHRQQLGLSRLQPVLGGGALAFGAMAVAAGIVGDVAMAALAAGRDVAAEGGGAAGLDGRHDLQLAKAQMAGPGPAPGRPVGAEDIRDLQSFARHDAA